MNKWWILSLFLLLGITNVTCRGEDDVADKTLVRAVVYDRLLSDSGSDNSFGAYFIAADPKEYAFFLKFLDKYKNGPRLDFDKNGFVQQKDGAIEDKKTKKFAKLFSADVIKLEPDAAIVQGAWTCASTDAKTDLYYLKKENGSWTIIKIVLKSIS